MPDGVPLRELSGGFAVAELDGRSYLVRPDAYVAAAVDPASTAAVERAIRSVVAPEGPTGGRASRAM